MRVTTHSDYALRVLIYVALAGDHPARVREIAEAYDISRNHLVKVVGRLAEIGVLETTRGRNGGIRLARPPEAIVLGEVMRELEDTTGLVECFGAGGACIITPACGARRMFREAQEAFFAVFDKYTLKDLLGRSGALAGLLLADPA